MRTILLNPGPVTLSGRVRTALTRDDLCHREPEFADLQRALRRKLLAVYDLDEAKWAAILLTGSGTAAVEAMVSSCVPHDGRLLSIENGVYGERMSRMAAANGIECDRLTLEWGAALDLEAIEAALNDANYSHLSVVHHETTTGRLNRIAPLAEVCREHNVSLLLDAVSSFGAEEIEFDQWPIDACSATANKCLHGVPGTAFAIVRRDGLDAGPARSVYLDLAGYLKQQDAGGTPFTQSVQTFYALDEALDEFFEAGGRPARRALFAGRMALIRGTLLELGVKPILPDGESSCVLNSFELPKGHSYAELHDALKARGFVIYAGQGQSSSKVFRISAMGDIAPADLERLCSTLRDLLG